MPQLEPIFYENTIITIIINILVVSILYSVYILPRNIENSEIYKLYKGIKCRRKW